jgi:internalin A
MTELVEEEQAKIGLTPRNVSRQASKRREAPIAADIDDASLKAELRLQYGSPPSLKLRYYVSYAWSDEGKDREAIVDRLCEEAGKRGTPILRDKKVLGFGNNIAKFMRDIGKGDRVFVILSDKYLKSCFCMFELFEIWRNSRQDEEEFLKRCRVFTLGDAEIWSVLGRLKYAKHWKMQFDEMANAVNEVGPAVLGKCDYAQFKLMQDFVNHVGDVLATFANIVQPRGFEDLVKYGFDDAPEIAMEAS